MPLCLVFYWPDFLQVEFSRIHKVDRADKAKDVFFAFCLPCFFSFCLRLEELNTKASSWGALRLVHSFTLDAESLDVLCRHGLSVSLVRCETSETRRMRSIGLLLVHVPQAQRHTCLALRTLHPTNPMEFVFLRIGKGCSNLVDLES